MFSTDSQGSAKQFTFVLGVAAHYEFVALEAARLAVPMHGRAAQARARQRRVGSATWFTLLRKVIASFVLSCMKASRTA
ncbi:hypothetical protein HAV22_10380 [Massilia sp. TW-1]|uniref:Uncharacterized protein n=1 Tax=Telluria antibiotica TaxID=2717319 RepID=A0ABX0PBT7_9BURK|nr:hypothetical protein [Telluria antibiotica]NIA54048.1 hypothetical protein [Telluria antibiotica]